MICEIICQWFSLVHMLSCHTLSGYCIITYLPYLHMYVIISSLLLLSGYICVFMRTLFAVVLTCPLIYSFLTDLVDA